MSPSVTKHELYAGLFLVVGLILFGLSIWILGAERQVFASLEPFKATFQDIKGLNAGAPVRLGGITIGRVDKIGFSEELNDTKVYVTILINDGYIERIREDSEVSIETQGLLGDKFVSISSGTSDKQLLPGKLIKSHESGDFAAVLSKAERVVENTVEISNSVKQVAQDLHTKTIKEITESFKNISDISAEIKSGNGLLHAMTYSKTGEDSMKDISTSIKNISTAAANLNDALEAVKSGDGTLHTLIYGKSPQSMDSVIQKLDETATNLKIASEALAQGTGTLGALLIDSKVYDNIVEVTDEAKRSILLRGVIRSSLKDKQ